MRWTRYLILSSVGLILSLAFYNCSPPKPAETKSSSISPNSNGEGYRGKTYVNRGTCSVGSGVRSRIELLDETTASVSREDCVDVTPYTVNISTLGLVPYNLDNLLHGLRVFDVESGIAVTQLLCRGTEPYTWANGTSGGQPVQVSADLLIFNSGASWTAKIKLGWMDQGGVLLDSKSSMQFNVLRTAVGTYEDYQGGDLIGGAYGWPASDIQSFDLAVSRAGNAPFMGSITMILGNSFKPAGQAVAGFTSVVVNCYPQ